MRSESDSVGVVGLRNLDRLLDIRISGGEVFLLLENEESIDWRQMGEMIEARRRWFQYLGVGPGSHVTLFQRTGVQLLVSMFTLYRMGAVAVMPNVASSARELAFIVSDSRSRFLLVGDDEGLLEVSQLASQQCSRRPALFVVSEGCDSSVMASNSQRVDDEPTITPETPATLLYTSGTTASPKGILYTHGNHIFAAETLARIFSLTPEDRVLHHFPLYHTNGICQMFSSLVSGVTLILRQRFRSGDFHELIMKHRATYTFLNATQIKMLLRVADDLKIPRLADSPLRRIGTGGEFNLEIRSQFQNHYATSLVEVYGSTESIAICSANPLSLPKNGSCGLPVLGYEMRLSEVDADTGQGEIVLRSPLHHGMFRGYWRRPNATREVLRRGFYWSGDIARQDADGYFYFLGRRGEMIKRAGENISPREVEAVINGHPAVREVAVIGAPDELRDEVPVAFVVAEGRGLSADELTEYCRELLANFKVPDQFYFLENLPILDTGKVDRARLRAMSLPQ
jgi:crotonobetaine/carnitine-CoA ligase